MPAAARLQSSASLPQAGALPSSVEARRPPGVARESKPTGTLSVGKTGRPAAGKKLRQVVDSTVLFWGIRSSDEMRAKIRAQLRRLRSDKRRRYDPRLAPRIIAKRLHIPEWAVDEVLLGTIPEYEDWMQSVRAGVARVFAEADAKAAASWRKSA